MNLPVKNSKKILMILIALLLALFVIFAYAETANAAEGDVCMVDASNGLNLRGQANKQGTVVRVLEYGSTVTILKEVVAIDGTAWAYVSTDRGEVGYVSSSYLKTITSEVQKKEYVYEQDFESNLLVQGFPEDYKEALRTVHAAHPQWIFISGKTGLDWNTVLKKESKTGISLIASSSIASWKSTDPSAYNAETGKWKTYDSGGYVAASEEIIAYYLDPRNFLDDTGIFQFLSHDFDANTQTVEGVQSVLNGTFMSGSFPEDTYSTWAECIYDAGKRSGVNPYVLAAIIIVEQGTNGKGGCISGKESGYAGYYNFYNIGAYQTNTKTAVQKGLSYAQMEDTYQRPWNTRAKAILGGAEFYYSNYVSKSKNTQYFKKWNVMNGESNVGSGQYMTNIKAAESEAVTLKKGYGAGTENAMTFIIPVYDNMPAGVCEKPTGTTVLTEEEKKLEDELKKQQEETAKAEADAKAKEEAEKIAKNNELIAEGVENTTIKLTSQLNDGKIKISWTKSPGYKVDNYQVFRSTKKNSGYGTKPFFTSSSPEKGFYVNSKGLKKGTTYYYKVRGYRDIINYDGGATRVYTKFSNKCWRTVK